MRHSVRGRVVECLVPAVDSASIIAGVTDVGQRSSDFFNLYRFGKAGKEILFSYWNLQSYTSLFGIKASGSKQSAFLELLKDSSLFP